MVFAWMPTSPHERPTVYHARNRISCTLRKWLQVKLTALSSCAFHSVWHCPNGSRLTPYAPEALMSHGKCLAAIHRFQVNPSPQRHCPASLLARFFQNLKGHKWQVSAGFIMTDVFIGDRTWKNSEKSDCDWYHRVMMFKWDHESTLVNLNIPLGSTLVFPISPALLFATAWSGYRFVWLANESEGRLCQAIFFSTKMRNASVMSATVYSDNISLRNLWYSILWSVHPFPTTQKAFALAFAFAFAFALALAFALGFGAALASPVNVRILNHWITLDSWTCLNNSCLDT